MTCAKWQSVYTMSIINNEYILMSFVAALSGYDNGNWKWKLSDQNDWSAL